MEQEQKAELSEEQKWLDGLPEALRPIAERHGRALFGIVMQAGVLSEALRRIEQQGRGNRAIVTALQVTVMSSDALCKAALAAAGLTLQQFIDCKTDIERIMALSDNGKRGEGDRVSKGGIILNS